MRRLLISLAVLAALLVVADRVAAHLAEQRVAAQIQQSQRLSAPPSVSIAGFPFLTQALPGRYEQIEVGIPRLATPVGVELQQVDARLFGVRVPAVDAIAGKVDTIPVTRALVDAEVTFAALEKVVAEQAPGRPRVTLRAAPENRVAVSASIDTPLGRVQVSGQASVAFADRKLTLTVLPASLTDLPGAQRQQAADKLRVVVPLPRIPFDASLESVLVQPDGVRVTGSVDSFTLVP